MENTFDSRDIIALIVRLIAWYGLLLEAKLSMMKLVVPVARIQSHRKILGVCGCCWLGVSLVLVIEHWEGFVFVSLLYQILDERTEFLMVRIYYFDLGAITVVELLIRQGYHIVLAYVYRMPFIFLINYNRLDRSFAFVCDEGFVLFIVRVLLTRCVLSGSWAV
jgi:hypothetical protein